MFPAWTVCVYVSLLCACVVLNVYYREHQSTEYPQFSYKNLSQVAYDFKVIQLELTLKSLRTPDEQGKEAAVSLSKWGCVHLCTHSVQHSHCLLEGAEHNQPSLTSLTTTKMCKTMQLLRSKIRFSYIAKSERRCQVEKHGRVFWFLEILLILEIQGKLESGFFL